MLAFAEETNLFQENYLTQSTTKFHSLQKKPDTKIYAGMNKEKDNIRMLEDGYDLMGTSAFQGPFTEPNQALKHAQSIEADVVLVYDRKINEMTRTERLRQIHAEMKKDSKSEKNSVIEVSEADLQDKNSKFDFYATYWAKLPQSILGLHVIKLIKKNSDTKEKKEEAAGKGDAAKKVESPAERHTAARAAMNKRHEVERRDMHGNHREEQRKMAMRHEADHAAMSESEKARVLAEWDGEF
jgi:hypothetical protein